MKFFRLFFFIICPFFLFAQSSSFTIETVPNPKGPNSNGYVSDPTGIIGEAAVARINRIAAAVEANSTAEIAVVVLPSVGDVSPKDFSTALFNHWGIGKAGNDNGLLILTVMDQRRTEFETGYGMEGILPDVICYRVGMQELVPYFQQGKYGDGLVATMLRFQQIMDDPSAREELQVEKRSYNQSRDRRQSDNPWPIILLIYSIVALITGVFLIKDILRTKWSKDELYDKYKKIYRINHIIYPILLPIPCLIIFFWAKSLLKHLRDHPRFSRINGKPMHKLNEEEEDDYLEQGQITEEDIRSADYDVWITDNADDILILRYERRFSKYDGCPECQYKAYYKSHSEVLQAATYSSSGTRELIYSCKNCNYTLSQMETIPMKTRSSSGGGGSGGGGSWGGGSSGGGGAGVSW